VAFLQKTALNIRFVGMPGTVAPVEDLKSMASPGLKHQDERLWFDYVAIESPILDRTASSAIILLMLILGMCAM
jgi:hypothetical protein